MCKSAALGLLSGLALVVLTLIAVGIVNLRQSGQAVSAELQATTGCRQGQVVQDQGYGLTRGVDRSICGSVD